MIYVFSCSFSSGVAITTGRVWLWPVDVTVFGYKWVFNNRLVWSGYANSLFYTITAALLSVICTICGAYPLSRKNYQAKGFVEKFLTVSMLFGGGLIPTFIVVSSLGLYNNRIWMIISGIISISWIIMMRTFFASNVPYELFESARIDGISDFGYLIKIVLPLSKAIISVICLYAVVGKWNSYMTPLLYLRERKLWPLQLILNEMLGQTDKLDTSQMSDSTLVAEMEAMREAISNLQVKPDILLNDAVTIPEVAIKQVPIIKGDAKSPSIAAASILAKETRDDYMEEMAKAYPQYDFEIHKGYGTKRHYEAIAAYGPSPIHRMTFLKKLYGTK